MASQERLSVDAAAERLGITPDAVRSRIKRGTLWAVRRNGRVQVVLKDQAVPGPGGGPPPTRIPTNRLAPGGVAGDAPGGTPGDTPSDTALRLRAEVARQKHRVRALEAERDRLLRHLDAQHKFLDLECALRARLQDQIDRLCDRLAPALPETMAEPTEGADRLWKRLERQLERLGEEAPERGR